MGHGRLDVPTHGAAAAVGALGYARRSSAPRPSYAATYTRGGADPCICAPAHLRAVILPQWQCTMVGAVGTADVFELVSTLPQGLECFKFYDCPRELVPK